jgi:quinol---cytochrome c reductase cytochrome b subunit, bacillus type
VSARPGVAAGGAAAAGGAVAAGGWTGGLRRWWLRTLPPETMLPDTQPAYVASWIYVFGVLTLSALLVVLVTGGVLALKGPSWWHFSGTGRYVNSLHLWSVELFMFFMVIHLWGKFFMAAWRGKRALTWMTGAVAFLASVGTAFTGYLVQQNFDAQWISTQAKDGLNAAGIGAFFNVLDFGQMLMWHIVLLPLAVGLLTIWHVLLVRRRGVVPPLELRHRAGAGAEPGGAGPSGAGPGAPATGTTPKGPS